MTPQPAVARAIRCGTIAAGLVLLVLACAGTVVAQDTQASNDIAVGPPEPAEAEKPVLSEPELREKYVWATLGLDGAIGATGTSSAAQYYNVPPEWTGGRGYAQRWASAYAESAVAETTKYAMARLLHHDPSFTKCRCSGFRPRLRYALAVPFTARNGDGERVFSPAIFVGVLAGQVVSRTVWYPRGYGIGDGLETTATGLLSKMAVSIWKEFRPRRNLFNIKALKP